MENREREREEGDRRSERIEGNLKRERGDGINEATTDDNDYEDDGGRDGDDGGRDGDDDGDGPSRRELSSHPKLSRLPPEEVDHRSCGHENEYC